MKKLLSFILASLLLLSFLSADAEGVAPLRIGALKGPTAMGLIKLMKDYEGSAQYAVTLAASPDVLVPELVRGDLDLACIPVNLAAILYANTKGAIQLTNINTGGVLYLVEKGDTVKSLKDLEGRTLYASGKASTPEYALSYLLEKAGVSGVNLEWKAEHAEALAALLNDSEGVAMLPQPFVTVAQSKNPDIRISVDLNSEWANLGEGALITGVTVVRRDVLENRPDDVRQFLKDYQSSVVWVNEHTEDAAQLIGAFEIIAAPVAQKALPYCSITYVVGQQMKDLLMPFYQMLFDQNPASVGGSLPDDAFYFVP